MTFLLYRLGSKTPDISSDNQLSKHAHAHTANLGRCCCVCLFLQINHAMCGCWVCASEGNGNHKTFLMRVSSIQTTELRKHNGRPAASTATCDEAQQSASWKDPLVLGAAMGWVRVFQDSDAGLSDWVYCRFAIQE